MKCWCTMPMRMPIASRGEPIWTGSPRRTDLALVGLEQPVEDVHERGLARPVLPEQGVHLAAAQVEIDAVVRGECAEALGDALQLEGERVALLGQGYLVGVVGMSVISPDSIFASASSTCSVYFAPSALVSP